MLERKIMNSLIKWKDKENRMSLVVKGARQVGKTYIIKKFIEDNYENYLSINFIENEKLKSIFDGDLDVETILKQISFKIPDKKLTPEKTVIFLDEIQACPRARTALKFFP